MDNKAMFKISYGLFVLSSIKDGKDNGCIINTAMQVTAEPNRISIAVNKANYTHDIIAETGKLTVSTISQDADFELFKRFGFQSGRDTDKFADFSGYKRAENGVVCITEGTNSYIAAEVEQSIDLGSHTMFICKVTDAEVLNDTASATYEYYHANIKPKPQESKPAGKIVWRCTICGYEHEAEELPADFICPLCKHPASDFEKVIK